MKVICIDNKCGEHLFSLTIGKEYESECSLREDYEIVNDYEDCCPYPKYLFITKSEIRNQKLEEIGI